MSWRIVAVATAVTLCAFSTSFAQSTPQASEGPMPLAPPPVEQSALPEVPTERDAAASDPTQPEIVPKPDQMPLEDAQELSPATDTLVEEADRSLDAPTTGMTTQRVEDMSPEEYQNFTEGIWVFLGIIGVVWVVQTLIRRAWLRWWYKGITRR